MQHASTPKLYTSPANAQQYLLPSLEVPSDHEPVVADLHLPSPTELREGIRWLKVDKLQLEWHLRPTQSVYPGLRLALPTEDGMPSFRCGTVVAMLHDGASASFQVDNTEKLETIALQPFVVSNAASLALQPARTRLMICFQGSLRDAVVVNEPTGLRCNCHTLHILPDVLGDEQLVEYDLNEYNHVLQRFASVVEYNTAVDEHCRNLLTSGEMVEDAITGNKLKIADQLLYLTMETGAEGADGSTIAGVQRADFAEVKEIRALVKLLLADSVSRDRGMHEVQPVLLCAGPGTGKTWTQQQLIFLLASSVHSQPKFIGSTAPRLVPLLIYVQKLARIFADSARQTGIASFRENALLDYIANECNTTQIVAQVRRTRSHPNCTCHVSKRYTSAAPVCACTYAP